MTFGFREPYQVLGRPFLNQPHCEKREMLTELPVDAEMVQDSCRFKMDLAAALERTVHAKAKPSKHGLLTLCAVPNVLTLRSDYPMRNPKAIR